MMSHEAWKHYMGTSRHQEKSAAGKNKRLMRNYFQVVFCLVGWPEVLFCWGVFVFVFLKKKHYNKSYRWYSPVEESSTCDFDLYLESSRATCVSLMMMKKLFPVH